MENTHEKIIAAARELFEKKGFAAATTREIADLAGVSEVTLFRHFTSKRALFEETLHSCIHPYKVDEYLENDVTYDLKTDLTSISYNLMETYKRNAPLMRMIMRDKIRESVPEMDLKKKEHGAESRLIEYFTAMHNMGKLSADPQMALKFYMSNISGYFMRNLLVPGKCTGDMKYFEWMVGAVISVLQPQ